MQSGHGLGINLVWFGTESTDILFNSVKCSDNCKVGKTMIMILYFLSYRHHLIKMQHMI